MAQKSAYEDEKQTSGHHDDLGVHQELREAEADYWQDRFNQPSANAGQENDQKDDGSSSEAASKNELASSESGSSGPSNSGSQTPNDNFKFSDDQKGGSDSNLKRLATVIAKNKGLAIGSTLGGGSIVTIVLVFIVGAPVLKVEDIITNLTNHDQASSESAISNETDNLFTKYIETRVLPSYKSCGEVISSACTSRQFGSNPVADLYKSWSQARLETKLANYDIHLEYNTASKTWTIKAPGLPASGDNIGVDGTGVDGTTSLGELVSSNKAEIRSGLRTSLDTALENETKWKQIFIRYKVGRLVEEKYGIRRCLVFCAITDPLSNALNDQKKTAEIFIVQRVILPHDQIFGTALICVFTGCDATTAQPNADPAAPAENGVPENTTIDAASSSDLRTLAAESEITSSEDLAKLLSTVNDITDKGLTNYLISQGLGTFLDQGTADTVADQVPIVGWINMAATIIGSANNAKGTLTKVRDVADVEGGIEMYETYSTFADEIHTGHVTSTEVGSMVDSLGAGNEGNPGDPELGGESAAEGTPLYADLMDNAPPSTNTTATTSSTLLSDLILPGAFADTTGLSSSQSNDQYLCNDGNPVPKGQRVCPEEMVGGGSSLADTTHEVLNVPGVNIITGIAGIWNNSIGWLFNEAGAILTEPFKLIIDGLDLQCHLPYSGYWSAYCSAKNYVESEIPVIEKFVISWLIPSPIGSNMSGGRKFDMIALGSDALGAQSAQTVLGGQALTTTQAAAITNQQQTEELAQFNQQPLFARIFSTDTSFSVVSKLAMDIPIGNFSTLAQDALNNYILNPFGKTISVFGSLFTPKASASNPAEPDPFGITQYGYPDGTIPTDPETYWQQNCTGPASQGYQSNNAWNEATAANIDPNTETPVSTTTDPCLLIEASINSSGGLFNTSNLTSDDLQDVNGGN